MEKELTIVLIVLLILFIIYMVIQKTDVCSIVRNEREEFNVGALSRKNIGLSLLGIGAVAGVGGYISNKKKLKEWNKARWDWIIYDITKGNTVDMDDDTIVKNIKNSTHFWTNKRTEIPYTPIYINTDSFMVKAANETREGQVKIFSEMADEARKIQENITNNSLNLANDALKYDLNYTSGIAPRRVHDGLAFNWFYYTAANLYDKAITEIKKECVGNSVSVCLAQIEAYEKRKEQLRKLCSPECASVPTLIDS